MQIKKLKGLWLILGMLITLSSCQTVEYVYPDPPVFPPKPGRVILVENSNVNEYRLMIQDIRWMMWASFAEWKAGIITEEVYLTDISRLEGVLKNYDEIFLEYQKRIGLSG